MVCLKKASSIRSIKNEMSVRKSFNVSADLVERLSECTCGRKPEMAGSVQGKCNGVRGHSLAELATPQDNEFRAGQLVQPHGASCMNARGADTDFGSQTELIPIIESSGGIYKNGTGINLFEKPHRASVIRCHNCFRVPRSVLCDVFHRFIHVLHDFHGQNQV